MFNLVTEEREWSALAAISRRVAGRYVPRDLAEDISQEVFVCLLTSNPPRDVSSYVSAVARKLAMSHLRADRRREAREQAWAGRLPPRAAESGVSGSDWLYSQGLPARERLLLGMLLEGRTVREISERAGRPRSNVQREIAELRRRLWQTPPRRTTALRP